jgi:hypothetical protein
VTKYLPIYLNDHLAGAVGGVQLARRAAAQNEGSDYGEPLARLAEEINEDRHTLQDLMKRQGVRGDPFKLIGSVIGEKLGRFKLNGELTRYSPLSRLEELEILSLGVEGKLSLWKHLRANVPDAQINYDDLIARAQSQRRRLERLRLKAAAEAFR